MGLSPAVPAAAAGACAALSVVAVARAGGGLPAGRLRPLAEELGGMTRTLIDEGRIDASFGGRRALAVAVTAGLAVGWSLIGVVGLAAGAVGAPLALRQFMRSRRRRLAARFDNCATDLALVLASSLAAGRSVRGALLTAGSSTPAPLGGELDRMAVDLTLGRGLGESLAALCERTGSARIRSLVAAVELHRGSGGDLVRLARELADAFRDRDRALRDARTATAQARYTAIVVAAIPFVVLAVLEFASPGMVTGAVRYVPTALMLIASIALMAVGVAMARRVGS